MAELESTDPSADLASGSGGVAPEECLNAKDLKLMRQIVIGIAPLAREITHLAVGRPVRSGSKAEAFLADPDNVPTSTGGGSHLYSAHLAIAFYSFAGIDHMRSFSALLPKHEPVFSLATLTRGAVEAFGKAHYLLQADSALELLRRHLSLGITELDVSTKHSEITLFNGGRIDGADYVDGLKKVLIDKGLKAERVGNTGLASTVLSDSAPGAPGRAFYSQLSGVAHGETAGVSMFIGKDVEAGIGFVRRRDVMLPYAGMLFATCRLVMNQIIDYFAVELEHRNRWNSVLERAEPWIDDLRSTNPEL
ncbi:hypothetical protein [Sinomonas cellulolyticus]|uniref:Uncharacterized protein n=1 Tax=Sinomonas cellulolyticus TaxID=2801916 RepID=A0ABS1K3V8_9MICC|nr:MULTISPECIES: hypothetical protein [Sinomonas]MBL0706128.1 hypothetical protein [Sinomonas cellulolyticus]